MASDQQGATDVTKSRTSTCPYTVDQFGFTTGILDEIDRLEKIGFDRRKSHEQENLDRLRNQHSKWRNSDRGIAWYDAVKQWEAEQNRLMAPIKNAELRASLPGEFTSIINKVMRNSGLGEALSKTGIPSRYVGANLFDRGFDNDAHKRTAEMLLTTLELNYGPPYESASPLMPHKINDLLAMVGQRGTGKTWLACALLFLSLWHRVRRNGREIWKEDFTWPLYRRAADIFIDVKSTFGSREVSQADILRKLAGCPLLVIDEIQERSGTGFEDVILVNLIDKRYGERLPTVLISNLEPAEFIKSVGDSVASRLQECGGIIEANWPSFRAR